MRKARFYYAKAWMKLADLALDAAHHTVQFAHSMALSYCRMYGHNFVTYLDGRTFCTVCELEKPLIDHMTILEDDI